MTGRPSKRDWARQLQAAALARDARPADKTRMGAVVVPSINIDKRRITLPKLRFMGEVPDPVTDDEFAAEEHAAEQEGRFE